MRGRTLLPLHPDAPAAMTVSATAVEEAISHSHHRHLLLLLHHPSDLDSLVPQGYRPGVGPDGYPYHLGSELSPVSAAVARNSPRPYRAHSK